MEEEIPEFETTPEISWETFDWETVGLLKCSISLEMLEEDQTNGKTFPDALYHNDKMVSRNSFILNPISEDCEAWFPDSGR